jgi:23S rRNA (adenine1618-N6)-methyltransferase
MPRSRTPPTAPIAGPIANRPRDRARPGLHPRNRHQGQYDFPRLVAQSPALAGFVLRTPAGTPSIDFADPLAVRALNRALLLSQYGIRHWDIPADCLCPPVPGRADYLHGLADLLASSNAGEIPRGSAVRVLDIGVGANCIYPLIGHSEYGWRFVGSDVDRDALAAAAAIVAANGLGEVIELRQQTRRDALFAGVVRADECFDLSLCNPPFHASAADAARGSTRKWQNLGKRAAAGAAPRRNFGGRASELWCPGGEAGFVRRMIDESAAIGAQVRWFSTLVSKGENVAPMQRRLRALGATALRVVPMAQGNKQSRFVAWSFVGAGAPAAG